MRKVLNIAALLAVLLLPSLAHAQSSTIVADGTATNSYVPVYGLWMDNYNRSQFVYPASMLGDLTDGSGITELTFFCSSAPTEAWTSSMSVKMMEVDFTTFTGTSFVSTDNAEVLYTGTLDATSGTMTVILEAPYIYGGGNLLVEFYSNTSGNWKSCTWLGVSSTGSSLMGYNSSGLSGISPSQRNFLPKVEIAYAEGGEVTCYRVKNLTATDIASDELTLHWLDTSNTNATYTVAYWTAAGDTTFETVTDTFFTVTDLNASTQYFFAVSPNCADGTTANATTGNWRTECGEVAIPYTEGFEGFATMAPPDCWTVLGGNLVYVRNTGIGIHSGSKYLDFRGSTTPDSIQTIALPPMGQPTGELQVRFWTRPESFTNGSCGSFSVGYMTDITADSSFVELVRWNYDDFTEYEEKEVPMIGAPDDARIVLRHNSVSYNWYWFVDDLVVEPIPACPHPTSVSAANVTSDGADITIVGLEGLTFRLYWTVDGTAVDSVDVAGTTHTLTGLNSNTAYTVTAVAVCEDGSLTSGVSTSFRTACDGYTEIPYYEGFENLESGSMPFCWQQLMTGSTSSGTFPSVYVHTNARSGNAYFEFESAANSSDTEMVALPAMQNIAGLTLTMWISNSSDRAADVEVGVLENDGTFTLVKTLNLTRFSGTSAWSSNYHEYNTYFTEYTGSGERIAIRVVRSTPSQQFTLFVDDLSVTENNGCYPLAGVSVAETDSTSITLAWSDTLNSGITYSVAYWTEGGDTMVANGVADTSYTVTDLSGNTLYYFTVTPNCTTGDGTPLAVQARTACGTTGIPYIEGFEGHDNSQPPTCWTQLNGNPRVMTSYPHTGSKHLYFSGGQPNTIALPRMGQPTGELQVRFWTRPESYSYSSCGSFSVGYMTDINDDSTFVEVASWLYSEWTSNEYVEKEVPMTGAPDNATIVLRHNSGSTSYFWYVDDLVVEVIPACPRPVSVTASNVTATDADVTIVGEEGATYRLWWSDGETTDSIDITTASHTITGLTGSTSYTVSVATVCEDGSVTTPVSTSFRTPCDAGSCDLLVSMEDSYGDGWNNAAIYGYVGADQVFSATLSGGSNGSYTYSLCATDSLVLKWHSGSFDDETSFEVTVGGEPVASGSGSNYSENQVIGTANGCPACPRPSSVTVSNLTATDADITIEGTADATFRLWWSDGITTDSVDITTASHTLTGLTGSTNYTVSVATICEDGSVTLPVSVQFRTPCDAGGCDVLVNMTDSYGDGWNNAAIYGYVGTEQVFTATLNDGSNGSYTYSLCATDTLVLKWHSGTYDGETSFDVTVGGDPLASASGNDYDDNEVIGFSNGCPACGAPSGFAVDSVSASEITFHWDAGNVTEWVVTVNGDSTNAVNVTTNSMTLTGLSANTNYAISISSVCEDGSHSNPINNNVRTACGAITNLPWTEDFDSYATTSSATQIPCWDYIGLGGYVNISGSYAHSGNSLRFYPNSSNSTDHVLVLPEFGDEISTLELAFWTRPESTTYSGSLSVGYVTDPQQDSTFVEVMNIPCSMGTTYALYEALFTNAPDGSRIALRHNVGSSTYYYWFVDDIEVHVAPACPHPMGVAATAVFSDNITVAFNGSISGDYLLTISDSANYSDTVNVSGDSSYTFNGLTPLTTYYISVYANCGTDLSYPVNIVVTTSMVATTLPYSTGFEAGQDVDWLLENGSQTNQWAIGSATSNGGTSALYISNDGGTSNDYSISNTSSVYAYKTLTFDVAGSYGIGFDWKANGESTWDFLRVFLVPASVELTAGNTSGISSSNVPAGWIALDGGQKLNLSSNWQSRFEMVDITTATNYNLVFYWRNDASGGSIPPAAIDNIEVAAISCPTPTDVEVSNVTGVSATISWTPAGSESEWKVTLNGVSTVVGTATYTATGLANSTHYSVNVRAVCGDGDTSFASNTVEFTTGMCDNPQIASIGDPDSSTTTSYYAPVNTYYNYSLSETIIEAAELGGPMDISAISYYYDYSSPVTSKNDVSIWIQPTTKSTFSGSSDIEPLDSANAVMVYSGNLNCSQGWNDFAFSTHYAYTGTGNLLVIVDDNSGAYNTSSHKFRTAPTTGNKTIARNSDTYNPDIANLGGSYSGSTNVYEWRPVMRLVSCGEVSFCAAPAIQSATATETTATVTFDSPAETHQVAIVVGNVNLDAFAVVNPLTETGNSHTFNGLSFGTAYTIGVRAVCDDDLMSEWALAHVTTSDHPCYTPTDVTVSNLSLTGATISWTPGEEGQSNFEVHVYNTTYDSTFTVQGTSLNLNGLYSNVTYSVEVRAICDENYYSEWTAAESFTTADCVAPTGVTATANGRDVTVSWQSTGASRYRVAYFDEFTSSAEAEIIEVTDGATSTTVTVPEGGMMYSFFVYAYCGEALSNPSEEVQVEILGIAGISVSEVNLYPNPASTTVTVSGLEGECTVTVVDMNGRMVYTATATADHTIDLTGMAKGAYFVRITGEQATAVRKLIVK